VAVHPVQFDFYWYAETGAAPPKPGSPPRDFFPKTERGGPFLEAALDAFVAAPNSRRLQFCLHFCNQDWVDVHPAKYGYHATGRPMHAVDVEAGGVPPVPRCGVRCALQPGLFLTGIYLCDVCSCYGILRAQRTRVTNDRSELLNMDGWMSQEVYHAAFDHIATKFFSLPNYLLGECTLRIVFKVTHSGLPRSLLPVSWFVSRGELNVPQFRRGSRTEP
jgi:hypothetical protein